MSIVDLTFDSSDDEVAAMKRNKVTPLSDTNIQQASTSKGKTNSNVLSSTTNPNPPTRTSAKSMARVTSAASILNRLSMPIPFASVDNVKKEEVAKPNENSEDSDSDSANLFSSSSFFFPNAVFSSSSSVKRENEKETVSSKRVETTTQSKTTTRGRKTSTTQKKQSTTQSTPTNPPSTPTKKYSFRSSVAPPPPFPPPPPPETTAKTTTRRRASSSTTVNQSTPVQQNTIPQQPVVTRQTRNTRQAAAPQQAATGNTVTRQAAVPQQTTTRNTVTRQAAVPQQTTTRTTVTRQAAVPQQTTTRTTIPQVTNPIQTAPRQTNLSKQELSDAVDSMIESIFSSYNRGKYSSASSRSTTTTRRVPSAPQTISPMLRQLSFNIPSNATTTARRNQAPSITFPSIQQTSPTKQVTPPPQPTSPSPPTTAKKTAAKKATTAKKAPAKRKGKTVVQTRPKRQAAITAAEKVHSITEAEFEIPKYPLKKNPPKQATPEQAEQPKQTKQTKQAEQAESDSEPAYEPKTTTTRSSTRTIATRNSSEKNIPENPPSSTQVDTHMQIVVDDMVAMAEAPIEGTESRDYLEMINTCRFLQYALNTRSKFTLYTLYKRFIKTKRYIPIEIEYPTDTTVIESPVKSKVTPPPSPVKITPTKTVKKVTPVVSPYSPLCSLPCILMIPFKASQYYLEEQPCDSSADLRQDPYIHTLCSCLHTEFDFRLFNQYLLHNHSLKESWINELICKSVMNNLVVCNHLKHLLLWISQRFQLPLSFFNEFIKLSAIEIHDRLIGKEEKRKGRKVVVDAAQQKREEEEKEHNQQAHVFTSLTILSLLVSILTDQIRNNQNCLNIQIAMDNSIRDCILVFWEKETLLSQVPSLITYGKALVVKFLCLLCAYQNDENAKKEFLHLLVLKLSNDILLDILLLCPDEHFKIDILSELATSRKTRFNTMMKIPAVAIMAKQYGFSTTTKISKSATKMIKLVEKIRKIKEN